LNFALLGISVILVVTIVMVLFSPPDPATGTFLIGAIGFLVANFGIFYINLKVRGYAAAAIFLTILTALTFFTDEPMELIQGRSLFFLSLPIVAASILLRPYTTFVVALLSGVILNVMAANFDIPLNLFAISGFITLALFSWLSASRMELALKNVQEINKELDNRVRERTLELETANQRLKGLDKLKSKFVSDVSHELRTPVSNLTIYLDMLQSGGNEEKNKRYISILRDESERLTKLVNDVLDLSRLEMGTTPPRMEPVNLNSIVETVVAAHSLRAEVKGLDLKTQLDSDLPLIMGDADKLKQVIINLIGNAINYTREGFIRASSSHHAGRGEVRVSVSDSGYGIAAEEIEHIFERFYRGKHASQSAIAGSGLGLAITRELVELHNGRMEVESEEGRGSTFSVILPAYTP
jgi:signal transduction histidine kinase